MVSPWLAEEGGSVGRVRGFCSGMFKLFGPRTRAIKSGSQKPGMVQQMSSKSEPWETLSWPICFCFVSLLLPHPLYQTSLLSDLPITVFFVAVSRSINASISVMSSVWANGVCITSWRSLKAFESIGV